MHVLLDLAELVFWSEFESIIRLDVVYKTTIVSAEVYNIVYIKIFIR